MVGEWRGSNVITLGTKILGEWNGAGLALGVSSLGILVLGQKGRAGT